MDLKPCGVIDEMWIKFDDKINSNVNDNDKFNNNDVNNNNNNKDNDNNEKKESCENINFKENSIKIKSNINPLDKSENKYLNGENFRHKFPNVNVDNNERKELNIFN